jgi:hypothetical protein
MVDGDDGGKIPVVEPNLGPARCRRQFLASRIMLQKPRDPINAQPLIILGRWSR